MFVPRHFVLGCMLPGILLAGNAIDCTSAVVSGSLAQSGQAHRCCCAGNPAGCQCATCGYRPPLSKDRSLPAKLRFADGRQIASVNTTSAAIDNVGAGANRNACCANSFGTELSVPTLQAQHVRIQT